MASYTAADVKTLRDRLGAGMLDSKNALVEAGGDIDKAIEILRVKGLKGVEKRSGRATTAGLVAGLGGEGDGLPVHHGSAIRRAPWARRRDTVSGRAPPSLMVMASPPGCRRATKSATTAAQTSA